MSTERTSTKTIRISSYSKLKQKYPEENGKYEGKHVVSLELYIREKNICYQFYKIFDNTPDETKNESGYLSIDRSTDNFMKTARKTEIILSPHAEDIDQQIGMKFYPQLKSAGFKFHAIVINPKTGTVEQHYDLEFKPSVRFYGYGGIVRTATNFDPISNHEHLNASIENTKNSGEPTCSIL